MTILHQDQFVSVCKQLKEKGNDYLADQVVEAESVLATILEFENDLMALGFQISIDCSKTCTDKELRIELKEHTMHMRFGPRLSLGFHDTLVPESFGEISFHLLVNGHAYEIYRRTLCSHTYGSGGGVRDNRSQSEWWTQTECSRIKDWLREILKFSKFLATAGILPSN